MRKNTTTKIIITKQILNVIMRNREEEKQYRQTISAANGETVTNAFTNPPNRRSNMPQFQCEFQILQWQTHEYKEKCKNTQLQILLLFAKLSQRQCKIVLHNFAFQLSLHLLQRDICSNLRPLIDINLWLLLTCNLNIQTQLFCTVNIMQNQI